MWYRLVQGDDASTAAGPVACRLTLDHAALAAVAAALPDPRAGSNRSTAIPVPFGCARVAMCAMVCASVDPDCSPGHRGSRGPLSPRTGPSNLVQLLGQEHGPLHVDARERELLLARVFGGAGGVSKRDGDGATGDGWSVQQSAGALGHTPHDGKALWPTEIESSHVDRRFPQSALRLTSNNLAYLHLFSQAAQRETGWSSRDSCCGLHRPASATCSRPSLSSSMCYSARRPLPPPPRSAGVHLSGGGRGAVQISDETGAQFMIWRGVSFGCSQRLCTLRLQIGGARGGAVLNEGHNDEGLNEGLNEVMLAVLRAKAGLPAVATSIVTCEVGDELPQQKGHSPEEEEDDDSWL